MLLLITGAGDDLQGIKRGIMELADAIAALDPDVKITPLARLGRLWTHACRYFSSYYPVS